VELALSQTLSRQALSGSSPAWEALIRTHDRCVVLSLLAAGAPPQRAKELAHDAWARLIEQQRLGRLAEFELPGLAIRQARFLWLDELRARARAASGTVGEEALAAVADAQATAEERCLSADRLARARGVLDALPESSRRVFLMIYNNPDRPHTEVAAQVGLSVQRVRQILCEVRKRMREALEE